VGEPLPGIAPVAMQQGTCTADNIYRSIVGMPRRKFVYRDRGIMATVGRSRAVVQLGGLHLQGFFAWVIWLAVHIALLIGFRNRVVVLLNWFWSYVTLKRGARLITKLHRF
jgi:NADH dehydrogenase